MKCSFSAVWFLLSFSFPITPPPSSCQAEEVGLSRHLICLVLSLALRPQSNPQIHAPCIDLMSAAAWQWCTNKAALVLVLEKLMGYRIVMYVTRWQDTMGSAGWHVGLIAFDIVFFVTALKTQHIRQAVCLSDDDELMEGCLKSWRAEIQSVHHSYFSSDTFTYCSTYKLDGNTFFLQDFH